MKTITKSIKWLVSECKWLVEYQTLHLRAFAKEIEGMFSYDKSSIKNASYRFVFSIGLGTILFFLGVAVYSATQVVVKEYPNTKEYVAKILMPKSKTVIYPTIAKEGTIELSGNSGELESNMQETHDTTIYDQVGNFSAYNTVEGQTDSSPFTTADGTDTRVYKECIVAHNDLPLGTVIDIEGIGECSVKDRMNKRYNGMQKFDLCMRMDLKGAKIFGRKDIKYLIK